MSSRNLILFAPLAFAAVLYGTTQGAVAQNKERKTDAKPSLGKYQQIIERSPFRNRSVPQAAASSAGTQLHFTGLIRIGDKISVGLEDIVQRRSYLLSPGESKDGVEVQSVDEKNKTVVVKYNGSLVPLNLEKPPSESSVAFAPPPPALQPTPFPPVTTQPGSTNSATIPNRRMRIPRSAP